MYSLEGKTVVITGAAQGMGAADAKLLAQHGAQVVLTDVKPGGEEVAKELGARAVFVQHDVTKQDQWARVVATAIARFGRIDVLVNNAGGYRPADMPSTDEASMDYHYRVNQLGVFFGMKSVVECMKAVGGGSIVNVVSQAALQGHPGMFAYSASKWACRGMSRSAAADLAPFGIRVNSIYPGGIKTGMLDVVPPEIVKAYVEQIPLKRLGTPDEVAQLVLYLASDASAYVTGSEFAVDGGLTG